MNADSVNNQDFDYKSLKIDCEPDQLAEQHFAHGDKVAEIAKCRRNAVRILAETSSLIIYVPDFKPKKIVTIKEETEDGK